MPRLFQVGCRLDGHPPALGRVEAANLQKQQFTLPGADVTEVLSSITTGSVAKYTARTVKATATSFGVDGGYTLIHGAVGTQLFDMAALALMALGAWLLVYRGSPFTMAAKASGRNFWPPATPQTKLNTMGCEKNPCFAMRRVLSMPPMS